MVNPNEAYFLRFLYFGSFCGDAGLGEWNQFHSCLWSGRVFQRLCLRSRLLYQEPWKPPHLSSRTGNGSFQIGETLPESLIPLGFLYNSSFSFVAESISQRKGRRRILSVSKSNSPSSGLERTKISILIYNSIKVYLDLPTHFSQEADFGNRDPIYHRRPHIGLGKGITLTRFAFNLARMERLKFNLKI